MLTTGAFLSSGDNANFMTISWGGVGYFWGKKVAFVPVRKSRYTKEFIDKTGYFALSIPDGKYATELKYIGSHSGRNVDKIKETGLTAIACDNIPTQKIQGCETYFECKVITSFELTLDMLPEKYRSFYATGDTHVLYIGEIL